MRVKIGVLSDTHGILRPAVLDILRGCTHIIHAGDFADLKTYEQLKTYAPLYTVRGNNDYMLPPSVRERNAFRLGGVEFAMAHNRRSLPLPEELGNTQVVIFGHSHQYFEQIQDGRLYLNPGSCGKRRFGTELTMALLYADSGAYTVQRVDLPQ